ncbi:hypothetical protein [Peribacillus acanthi]|uniref:hypothetical protein n=1 Tax=Peribacillus acanthi TaxID=2171554 RepID=UPI001300B404|nr:hypothetical protein [Peribacillus acanthi]
MKSTRIESPSGSPRRPPYWTRVVFLTLYNNCLRGEEKRLKKWSISVVIFIAISSWTLFYSKIYYPSLPIDSVSKREVVQKANKSDESIVYLTKENGYEWYISKMNQGEVYEQLKQMMEEKGWKYKQQMGAGFIFQKQSKELIVESEMWTGRYVIFQIPISE